MQGFYIGKLRGNYMKSFIKIAKRSNIFDMVVGESDLRLEEDIRKYESRPKILRALDVILWGRSSWFRVMYYTSKKVLEERRNGNEDYFPTQSRVQTTI